MAVASDTAPLTAAVTVTDDVGETSASLTPCCRATRMVDSEHS
jgi:hypothetical protein